MCGIFGILINESSYAATSKILENSLKELFLLSETRGREAAGLVVKKSDSVYSLKQAITASDFIKLEKFNKLIDSHPKWFRALLNTLLERLRKANARVKI
jgi:glucosamine 6-phosphate synthetase-like amidotransferase/phosphosugar isomerase protein